MNTKTTTTRQNKNKAIEQSLVDDVRGLGHRGDLTRKVIQIIVRNGNRLHVSDVVDKMAKIASPQKVRNILYTSPRFRRVGKSDFKVLAAGLKMVSAK